MKDKLIKIIFFGTPSYVIPLVENIKKIKTCQLVAVITQPDKAVGRKKIITPSPIKQWALEQKILVLTPMVLDENFKTQIANLKFDLGILAAYGKIIPKWLIDLFPIGILVVHPSLLPKYRGPSPVQAAILSGDNETGVSFLKMDEKIDHGPIIFQFKEKIKDDDTTATLRTRLFEKAAKVLVDLLPTITQGKINFQKQNHQKATFTKILEKNDGFIPPKFLAAALEGKTSNSLWTIRFMNNYSLSPDPITIERFIRAMIPWPEAFTKIELKIKNQTLVKRLKILKAHLEPLPFRKENLLVLDSVQLEGKKETSWKQFQNAYKFSLPKK